MQANRTSSFTRNRPRWISALRAAGLLVAAAMGLAGAPARAQDYPNRTITLVCPWGPGGSAGNTAMSVAEKLSRALGQPVVVDYKPGASGAIGSQYVSRSRPDGYTLLLSGYSSHVVGALGNKVPFHPVNDFTHIAYVAGAPWLLVVNSSVKANTFQEFIAYTKAQPRGVNVASPGTGTLGHLIIESMRTQAGANVVHVPYKSSGPAVVDIVANHVPAGTMTIVTAAPQIKAGQLRPLAITAQRRSSLFPDVPTLAESGFPSLSGDAWHAISGPPGMPRAVVERLNSEIRKLVKDPAVVAAFARESMETQDMPLDAVTAFFKSEIEHWKPVVEKIDLKQ